MNKTFNEVLVELEALIKRIKSHQPLDTAHTVQTIFEVENWIEHFSAKDPHQEMFGISKQISLLETIYENQGVPTPADKSLITFAGIFLKGKYDPTAATHKLTVMKESFLKTLGDSQLIILKDTTRLAWGRLNQNDSTAIMKVLNKNRVLIDEILMNRVDPATKLNGLID